MFSLRLLLPISGWSKNYNKSFLRPDIIAGITIVAFIIPESIAYAALAGFPPQTGLYAALAALLVYFIFGTSKQLSVGPTSTLSLLIGSTIGTLSIVSPNNLIILGSFVALVTGIFGILAWLFRMGFVAKFISHVVITGFSTGVAFFIAATQLPKLCGISGAPFGFFDSLFFLFSHFNEIHLISLFIGIMTIIVILVFERFMPKIPGLLVVVIVSTALFSLTEFQELGVNLIGFIPSGLPLISLPPVSTLHSMSNFDILKIVGLGFACFILSYSEGIGTAQTFAWKYKYKIDNNREFFALGVSNLLAGLTQGFPVGGSISRSAVNDEAGSKSPLSSGVSGLVLVVVLIFFVKFFSNLPEPVLAAIIIFAILKLVKIHTLKEYFEVNKIEFLYAVANIAGILILGIVEGLIIGIIISVLIYYKKYFYKNR
ncbi:putative sulfate transporterc [Methanobrevibacter cuticularis]|uniref:Putative sulfate transporterc n=1 Tax=Methanobrevibacter cuticularis TaxID=47311 RepID=A0A166CJ42_9EURY|nr:SulP family inorganic anion transporter [Methanobrevibacter cuticularis]KZX14757.1 putative sulfate transporterc [Methanobrevibacter cuticularis]